MSEQSEKKKIILFINIYVEMGGGEYSILNLLKGIDKQRFHPVMMFNQRGPFVDKVEEIGVETVIIPYQTIELKKMFLPKYLKQNLRASKEIFSYLKNNPIDIIQCSDVLTLFLIWFPVLVLKIPLVYSVIFYYEFPRLLLFNVFNIFMVNKIITNSKAVENHLLDGTMFLSHKAETVYNGIDDTIFYPKMIGQKNMFREELSLPSGTTLIGMVSRFDVGKGHKTFIEMASRILKIRKNVKFVIVGGLFNKNFIPAQHVYYNTTVEYYKALKLEDNLYLMGHRNDIPEILRGLDILVCPSVNEGFGLVILEAMASGVPVIAADSGGPVELIQHGKTGFHFQTGNSYSLEDAINECLESDCEAIIANAKERVRSEFSLSAFINHMEKMYKDY